MSGYVCCPTCGTDLGKKRHAYLLEMEKLESKELNKEAKELEKQDIIAKIFGKLQCCTPRILCEVDLSKIIK